MRLGRKMLILSTAAAARSARSVSLPLSHGMLSRSFGGEIALCLAFSFFFFFSLPPAQRRLTRAVAAPRSGVMARIKLEVERLKKYGWYGVGTLVAVDVVTLGMIYAALSSGFDIGEFFCVLCSTAPLSKEKKNVMTNHDGLMISNLVTAGSNYDSKTF